MADGRARRELGKGSLPDASLFAAASSLGSISTNALLSAPFGSYFVKNSFNLFVQFPADLICSQKWSKKERQLRESVVSR